MKFRYSHRAAWIATLVSLVTGGASARDNLGIIAPDVARRNGLDRVWATQVEVGRNRGQVASVTPHVSTTQKITVFEVVHEGTPLVISERQLREVADRPGLIYREAVRHGKVLYAEQ